MTDSDGPSAGAAETDPSLDPHTYDPLLPRARSRPEPATVATAVTEPASEDRLGGWFDSVEEHGPSDDEDDEDPSAAATRERRQQRSRRQNVARAQVYAIAAVAAVLAGFAPGRPTGLAAWDLVVRMAFAFGITVACSHARRWTWMVMSGIAAAMSRDLAPILLAWGGLLLSFTAAVFDFRRRRVGAIVGALAVNALLRLAPIGPHGLTALIVAIAITPVVLSGYKAQRSKLRRRIRLTAWGVGALTAVAVAALGVAGLLGLGRVATATNSARSGLEYAKEGKQDESAISFTRASDQFESVEGLFTGWLVLPSRLVPVVGYQTDALGRMATIGRELTVTAEQVTTEADYRRVSVVNGRIDLADITAWSDPLAEVEAALRDADERSDEISGDWLLAPVSERHQDLAGQVNNAIEETEVARQAIDVAPDLLGANGVRRYFIAFTTPAESRGLGGFMGNWAILEADNGRLDLVRNGRSSDLARSPFEPERVLEAPADYLARYGALEPESQLRDVTFSPDFPSVAQAIGSVYPQTIDGTPIDGALAMDPYALAAMLEVTGPIEVEGLEDPLTSVNAADYLLREQYLTFDPKDLNAERKDVLEEASQTTFEKFISQPSYRPSQLATVLGPMVAERRLVAYSQVPDEEALIERIGMDGAFPEASGNDFMSLVTQNAGNNKIDIYLHREIDYDVIVDPDTGAVDVTATVTLRNDAPSVGLPKYVIGNRPSSGQPDGVNWMWFNFYSPHLLETATYNGQPMAVGEQSEFGRRVYQTYLPVPPGEEVVIVLELAGEIEPSPVYRLDWFQQPLVNTDDVEVSVRTVEPGVAPGAAGDRDSSRPLVVATKERTDQQLSFVLATSS